MCNLKPLAKANGNRREFIHTKCLNSNKLRETSFCMIHSSNCRWFQLHFGPILSVGCLYKSYLQLPLVSTDGQKERHCSWL
jgi:hypothetical protein